MVQIGFQDNALSTKSKILKKIKQPKGNDRSPKRSLKSVYGQQMGQGKDITLTLINHIPSFTPSVL